MCSSIVLYLTFISDNSLPFYAWKQEWVYIFYVASITEKKNRYHDLPSCIIMTCDRHLPLLSHVICHLLSHVICHCHFTSSAIVVSCHLPLSSHVICHCCLTSSVIVVSRHLPLSSHVICTPVTEYFAERCCYLPINIWKDKKRRFLEKCLA